MRWFRYQEIIGGIVVSKEIDKLIEQVLLEKNLSITGLGKNIKVKDPDPSGKFSNATKKNKANWNYLGVSKSGQYIQQQRDNAFELASLGGQPERLNKADIRKFVKDNIDYYKGITDEFKPGTLKAAAAINLILSSNSADERIKNTIINTIRDQVLGTKEIEAEKQEEVINQIISVIGSQEIPKDGDRSDIEPRTNPLAGQTLPRRSLETTEDKFTADNWYANASPELVNLFSSIDGDSIVAKLSSITNFSDFAARKDLNEWVKKFAGGNQFKAFTYGKVLAMFADLVQSSGVSEAGFEFERWMALLLNLPVAGAEQGAADNLGKILTSAEPPTKQTVFTSAKLYKYISGPNSPSQACAKLMHTTHAPIGSEGANSIFYFVAHKRYLDDDKRAMFTNEKGEEEKIKVQGLKWIESIDMYLIQIYQNEKKKLVGRFIDQTGAPSHSKPYLLVDKSTINPDYSEGNQCVLTPAGRDLDLSPHVFATLYIPSGKVTEESMQTAAEFLTDKLRKIDNQPITKAILDAATKIKNIEANVDSYASTADQKKGGTAYLNKITTDYLDLEGLYDQIFSYGEGEDQKTLFIEPERQKRSKTNESRSPLDQMIEAIIKQTLLK